MKRINLLALMTFILVSFSCNKETNQSDDIKGTWELVMRQAGMIPTKYFEPGNGNKLILGKMSYQHFVPGGETRTGTYTVVDDNSVESEVCLVLPEHTFKSRIIFSDSTMHNKQFLQVRGDTLSFLSGCFAYDGGLSLVYVRRESDPSSILGN